MTKENANKFKRMMYAFELFILNIFFFCLFCHSFALHISFWTYIWTAQLKCLIKWFSLFVCFISDLYILPKVTVRFFWQQTHHIYKSNTFCGWRYRSHKNSHYEKKNLFAWYSFQMGLTFLMNSTYQNNNSSSCCGSNNKNIINIKSAAHNK